MPKVNAIDHFVLTVADIARTVAFYRDALGMETQIFQGADGSTRTALKFGVQKINVHPAGNMIAPKARNPAGGSADLCFLSKAPLSDWQEKFAHLGVPVELGPVARTGATGPIMSLYLRDPDGNLIEVSNPC